MQSKNNRASAFQLFKFCPKCGSSTFKPSCAKSMYCEHCQFQYYFNASGATIALIETPDHELVVVQRAINPAKGMLDLPGGFIDAGETAEQAMKREIGEELGWEVNELQYVASHPNRYLFAGLEIPTIDFIFKCKIQSMACVQAMDDVDEVLFLKKEALNLGRFAFASVRYAVQLWLKNSLI